MDSSAFSEEKRSTQTIYNKSILNHMHHVNLFLVIFQTKITRLSDVTMKFKEIFHIFSFLNTLLKYFECCFFSFAFSNLFAWPSSFTNPVDSGFKFRTMVLYHGKNTLQLLCRLGLVLRLLSV